MTINLLSVLTGRIHTFTLTQTSSGFCASAQREGECSLNLSQYIRRDAYSEKQINIEQTINKSNLSVKGGLSS